MTMFGPKLTKSTPADPVRYEGHVERHEGVIVRVSVTYDSVSEKNWLHLLLSGSDELLTLAVSRGLVSTVSLSAAGDHVILVVQTKTGHPCSDVVEFTNTTLDDLRAKNAPQ